MRNVISSSSRADVGEEYAEQVEQLLSSPERETTQVNEWGQTDFYVRLHTYAAPGTGETMWAVDYSDPVSRELEETASREEAVARYVELVRDAAENLGTDREGLQERFTTTDVDGVPGPLPALPEVTPDQVEDLLDKPGDPVLYLDLDEDGDPVVLTGQRAQAPQEQVLLTRADVVRELRLDDDADRAVDAGMELSLIAHEAKGKVRAVADVLFAAPAA
ncbi:hypothetical protein [Streptomyces sp. NPDC020996]|uniref:hypothetical protein n=1 Tax=Streptomyces sp. NPDC020996 TaxID=3154791 RepID=UPI0033D2B322